MKRVFVYGIFGLLAGAAGLLAQQGASAVAKQPQVKSKGELEAVQAMFQAPDPDSRMKAAETLVTKYADTQFKDLALFFAAMSAEQKGEYEKSIVYGERAVEANAKNYNALYLLARLLAVRTREFDLDREEKLAKVEKYVKEADAAVLEAPRPNPQVTEEQWTAAKKDFQAQGHEALAMAAVARKKFDVAITEFKAALDGSSQPDPATMVRLANAYNQAGKSDDAIAMADKVMAVADAHPAVKQAAQAEKARAMQAKGGAKPAAAPGTTITPGTVEVKKP